MVSSEADDIEIVTAIAGGDRQALGALYDRYAPLLMAVGRRIIGDPREAEDVLHDVFLEVWRKAGDYSPERGSVRTWLLLRTRSRTLDRKRSPRLARATALDQLPERSVAAAAHDPANAADSQRLGPALERLPEAQREVLELVYFEGLTMREVGERVGVPTGTVKSRISAALAKLRAGLRVDEELSG